MALVPGFDHDVFISYARVDNRPLPGQQEGWVDLFHKNLNIMLAQRFGRADMVKIWWDERMLDGSTVFDDSIAKAIDRSAVLLCLYSHGYAASDYCKQELSQFSQKCMAEPMGQQVGGRRRVVNAMLSNLAHQQWPEGLRGTTGFKFHDATTPDDPGDPLDPTVIDFREQLRDLRDAVWYILSDMSKGTAPASAPAKDPRPNDKDTFTIYLGEVADTLRTPRKRIISDLEKKGFRVLAGVPPPDEVAAHEKATMDAVENADLTVHLLDGYPGRDIVGAPDLWYPQRQAEIALASDRPQMIWLPDEVDLANIEDVPYRLFLENLENGKASSKSVEFVRGKQSAIVQGILDMSAQIKAEQAAQRSISKQLSVLVDTHYNDQLHALELSRSLIENRIQPFINPQDDDPRKNMSILGDRLSQIQKLIFLYGSVSKDWLLERINVALQLIINNKYPIDDLYVYMAPPFKDRNDIEVAQRFLRLNVVDSSAVVDGTVMRKFVQELNATST